MDKLDMFFFLRAKATLLYIKGFRAAWNLKVYVGGNSEKLKPRSNIEKFG